MRQDCGLDRRKHQRFAMSLQATYCLFGVGGNHKAAVVCDMSSQGLLIEADEALSYGQGIEVYIFWPAKLLGSIRLRCVVRGMVVRSEPERNKYKLAVQFRKYEFRTCAIKVWAA